MTVTVQVPKLIDNCDGWRTYWYCDPPPEDVPFQCLRDEWSDDGEGPIRSVYEIKIVLKPGDLYVKLEPWQT
jgi:hypothetical protein